MLIVGTIAVAESIDLPFAAYTILRECNARITDAEIGARLLASFPGNSLDSVNRAAMSARALRIAELEVDWYAEPTAKAIEEKALPYLRQQAPGLSERLYRHVLHRILYSWMK